MENAVDLYGKLLIGTFSFIGPSFALLVPIFYPAILRTQQKHLQLIEKLTLTYEGRSQRVSLFLISKSVNDVQKLWAENKADVQLLNPRRQVKRLFLSLFLAIGMVILYHFITSSSCINKYTHVGLLILGVSLVSFGYCHMVLWQIFCRVVEIKQEEQIEYLTKLNEKPDE